MLRHLALMAAVLLLFLPAGYGCGSKALIEVGTSQQETAEAPVETQTTTTEAESISVPETTEEDLDFWETESQEPDHIHEYGDWTVVTDATK